MMRFQSLEVLGNGDTGAGGTRGTRRTRGTQATRLAGRASGTEEVKLQIQAAKP